MRKLHYKLSISLLGSLVVISVLTSALVIRSARSRLKEDLEYTGKTLADTIAAFCVETLLEADYPYLETYIRKAAQNSRQVAYIRVWSDYSDEEGRTERRPVAQYPPPSEITDAARSAEYFQSPIIMDIEGLAPEVLGHVVVALSTQRHAELVRTSTWQLVAGACVTFLLLASILTFTLKKHVLRPVRTLDVHANRIGRGELDQSIDLASEDELGRLAKTMEQMRLALKGSYEQIERQVRELRELDRMKDEFLANTSHELKTPLNGIVGLTDGMLLGDYGEVPESWEEPLQTIATCAERLFQITESILQFSQLADKKKKTSFVFDVHPVEEHLHECLLDVLTTADRKQIRFLITVPPGLQARYPRSELEQIIRILSDNAVKFTERGVVQVIVRKWDREETPGFQIAVRDTGRGIAAGVREKVFEPFVQGFQHETRAHGGVGLGLAIAKKLVDELGWKLILESEEGKGTAFTVLVPDGEVESLEEAFLPWPALEGPVTVAVERRETSAPRLPPAGQEADTEDAERLDSGESGNKTPVDGNLPHVLVADDDEVNRKVLWLALKNHYRVSEATGGRDCVAILEKEQIDLLLLDIMMPEMSGYDVLKWMKEQGQLTRVPVVVLSAKTSPMNVVKGLRLGAADYVGKPFHRDELLCRVQTQLKIKDQTDELRRQIQLSTQALELAAQASKVKSQFLANMSHEILTPLNGIYGFLSLATSERENREEQLEYLESAQECSKSLLNVANDILDIVKIDSRDIDVEWQACKPGAIVREVVAGLDANASERGLALYLASAPEVEAMIQTDPSRLRQIITNLVDNAIRFTKEGGVRVIARYNGGDGGKERCLTVDVVDTGIGLEPSQHEAVFDGFYQVDGSTTREYGGVGLGLTLARSYARILGGDVTVKSSPERGSTFTLRLPLVPKTLKDEPALVLDEGCEKEIELAT